MHCENTRQHSNLLASPRKACTSLPNTTLTLVLLPILEERRRNAATDTAHCENNSKNRNLRIQMKQNTPLVLPHRQEHSIKFAREDVQAALPPAVEDSARCPPALSSSGASSRAHWALHMSFPHRLPHCHTTFILSAHHTDRSILLHSPLLLLIPQSIVFATGAWMANVDRHACFDILVVHGLPFRSLNASLMAWQIAYQSLSTSGGPHQLSPTFVVSMKVRSPPSSPLRSVKLVHPFEDLCLWATGAEIGLNSGEHLRVHFQVADCCRFLVVHRDEPSEHIHHH